MAMDKIVLKAENISKQYRLGQLGTGTISHDLNRWWHKIRGKDDPYLKVGDANDRSKSGGSEYVWSLKDINFEVKQGDVLGIIGKNGAGKSTLLKILSQVTTPTTGEVKIKGRVASLLEVGTGFHPELSGRENIFLNGAILGMSKAEIKSKLDEIVDFSGVAKYIDTPVKRYSSGMMVRLGFAVAAHLEPEILIVDEVLAVGDQEFQDKCIGKMKDVSGQGRTVLFVSHNMGAIKSLCKTGLLLQHGRIHDHNTIENVINSYNKISVPSENHLGIENRMERKGSGAIKLIDLNISSQYSESIEVVGAGDLCRIKLTLNAFKKQRPPSFYVALIIRKNTGERMFTLSTDFYRKKITTKDQNTITFEIDKMPLSIGKYFIDVFVWDDGEVIDEIESVMEFSVIENDFYKFGVKQGPFIDTFFTEFRIT
jgi:lipopolysaccharide transport system ATP-binding protein